MADDEAGARAAAAIPSLLPALNPDCSPMRNVCRAASSDDRVRDMTSVSFELFCFLSDNQIQVCGILTHPPTAVERKRSVRVDQS